MVVHEADSIANCFRFLWGSFLKLSWKSGREAHCLEHGVLYVVGHAPLATIPSMAKASSRASRARFWVQVEKGGRTDKQSTGSVFFWGR